MNNFPASIESSLQEAGFSGTEILILKKLLDEDALTLRELAAKTGKSTGVLGQAMKKLLKRKIVTREVINDTPKYILSSLQAVMQWMEDDTCRKREALLRRSQDFESFLASLEKDRNRPDIQHYHGAEGMRQAYLKLLEDRSEWVGYVPIRCREEDDPLRDFRVRLFRERHGREMFLRAIAHDTPLGRRFRSRDPFEYRKTLLVPEPDFPIPMEKIIAGDLIACFNHEKQQASIIRYPDMARTERGFFETMWRTHGKQQPADGAQSALPPVPAGDSAVPPYTKLKSAFREFVLSRSFAVACIVFGLIAGTLTYALYRQTYRMNLQRLQERVQAVALASARQFNPADLEALQEEED